MHIQKEFEDEPSGKINTGNVLKSQSENAMTKPMIILFYVMFSLVKRKQDTNSHYIIFTSPDGLRELENFLLLEVIAGFVFCSF